MQNFHIQPVILRANDIDVFLVDGNDGPFVFKNDYCLDLGQGWTGPEVNVIEARNVSSKTILANNDINCTQVCLELTKQDPLEYNIHCGGNFWEFLLTNEHTLDFVPRVGETIGARNWIRLAYKAFDMGLHFQADNFDLPIQRDLPIRPPHKAKVDLLADWDANPFRDLELVLIEKKVKTKWRFWQITVRQDCGGCDGQRRANKACVKSLCFVCCKALIEDPKCKQHKRDTTGTVGV